MAVSDHKQRRDPSWLKTHAHLLVQKFQVFLWSWIRYKSLVNIEVRLHCRYFLNVNITGCSLAFTFRLYERVVLKHWLSETRGKLHMYALCFGLVFALKQQTNNLRAVGRGRFKPVRLLSMKQQSIKKVRSDDDVRKRSRRTHQRHSMSFQSCLHPAARTSGLQM